MKNLVLLLFIVLSIEASSSHLLGGDITYRLIDTSVGKYEFTLTLYRDCIGVGLGNEKLQIRTSTVYTNISHIGNVVKKEVTPICYPPDVLVKPTTNCPHGALGQIRGIEKIVYKYQYVIGKNKGWAYVGWGSCCRMGTINTIQSPGSQGIWIQAAFNTNYRNNSPLFKSDPITYWCALNENQYSIDARDSFDSKYITINGQTIIRDSIVYKFYSPFTAEAANPNTAVNMNNPSVTHNSTLSGHNFLYTSTGMNIDKSRGILKFTPTIAQNGPMAFAVQEYRAIPNSSGTGYHRQLISHICRDVEVSVYGACNPININGVIEDSLRNAIFKGVSEVDIRTYDKNIEIMFKAYGLAANTIRTRVKKMPNNQNFKGIRYAETVQTGSVMDTLTGIISIDSVDGLASDDFLIEIYYCDSKGIRVSQYFQIDLNIIKSSCTSIGDSAVNTNLNIKNVKISGGINNIDNTSQCNSLIGTQGNGTGIAGRYTDFSKSNVPKTNLIKGSTITLSVTDTACMISNHSYAKVAFIDWNSNGSFDDAGERYNISKSPYDLSSESIDITVPQHATLGKTLLRIVTRVDTPASNLRPCGPTLNANNNQGETEDYEVIIVEDPSNCLIYKSTYYFEHNDSFHFLSSGPSSIPSPYSINYLWTFSDGNSSTEKNPSIDSLPNGKYNWAKLKVCIDSGNINLCCDSSRIDSIENCVLSCNIIKKGDTLTAYPINGNGPYTFLWSNSITTASMITNITGTYYVYITDSTGCTTQCQINVSGITNLCSSYRDFSWTNGDSLYTFNQSPAIPSGLNPSYYWDFGNGITDTNAQPSVVFNYGTTNIVKLKYCIRDSAYHILCCDSVIKQVIVPNVQPNQMPCNVNPKFSWLFAQNGSVVFINNTSSMSSQMHTYKWSFDDGTSSTKKNPIKAYAANGTKNVCLRVNKWLNNSHMQCWDTICKPINVYNVVPCNRLIPNFNYSHLGGGKFKFINTTDLTNMNQVSIQFKILDSNIKVYNSDTCINTFGHSGAYYVSMKITVFDILTGKTCTKNTIKKIRIKTGACGCLVANNDINMNGYEVSFNNTSVCVDSNTGYFYKFGNGATSSDENPNYTYLLPGFYKSIMYVTNNTSSGICVDSFVRFIQIRGNNPCLDSGYKTYFNYNCPSYSSPVCGCDFKTYKNYCFAEYAGVKQYSPGPCPDDTNYVRICGYVYIDIKRNCSYDSSDVPLRVLIKLSNSSKVQYKYTNSNGYYELYLPKGTYQVSQLIENSEYSLKQICPANNASITVNALIGRQTYCNNDFYDTTSTCPDLAVNIHKLSNITPGFVSKKQFKYMNKGAKAIPNVILKYRFLSNLTVKSINSSTFSVNGNILTWNLGTVPAYSTGYKIAYLNAPTTLPLGTTVIDSAWIVPLGGDCNTSNNSAIYHDTCVASYDPNDKTAYPANDIDTSMKVLDYLVRFQNTGTAPAHNVRIEDIIDNNFDRESLEIHDQSHSMNHHFDDNGKIYFEFPNIMLPDSGTDYEASQGFVSYSVRLKDNLAIGTQLKNTAEIYFDFNDPIITNTTINTIVLKSNSSVNTVIEGIPVNIYPNPSNYYTTIEMDLDKSSKVSYTIYDMQGKLVQEKAFENTRQGSFKEAINLEHINSGVYILNLKVNGKESSFKVIKE